jgi:hypothetical protein
VLPLFHCLFLQRHKSQSVSKSVVFKIIIMCLRTKLYIIVARDPVNGGRFNAEWCERSHCVPVMNPRYRQDDVQ